MKKCAECQVVKPLEDFSLNRLKEDGRDIYCRPCKSIRNKRNWITFGEKRRADAAVYRRAHPLKHLLWSVNARCNNPSSTGYAYYGGKGIRCLLTIEDLEYLWERDGAALMACPSIDRVDSGGHYCRSNCRFLEKSENSRLMGVARKPGAKLTQRQVDALRVEFGSGVASKAAIGRKYGINHNTVAKIIQRKTWRE